MSKSGATVKAAVPSKGEKFQAICRVNTSITLNRYESFKSYSQAFLEILKADNGDHARLPLNFGYRSLTRGQILTFGDETEVDETTGAIMVYHREIFERLSKRFIELPCAMGGEVKRNFHKAVSFMPDHLKKIMLEKEEKETARFRREPILELYTGQELES